MTTSSKSNDGPWMLMHREYYFKWKALTVTPQFTVLTSAEEMHCNKNKSFWIISFNGTKWPKTLDLTSKKEKQTKAQSASNVKLEVTLHHKHMCSYLVLTIKRELGKSLGYKRDKTPPSIQDSGLGNTEALYMDVPDGSLFTMKSHRSWPQG